MDYIINPMWFYWLSVVDALRFFFIFILVFGSLGIIGMTIFFIWTKHFEDVWSGHEEEHKARVKKLQKVIVIGWIIWAVVFCFEMFVPSKDTMIEMQIARYATKQNVEIGIDAIKSATDYVIEAIKSLK